MASIAALRRQLKGPVKVQVATGERNEDGSLVLDPETGEPVKVTIMEKVFYRPFVITPQLEKEIAAMGRVVKPTSDEESGDDEAEAEAAAGAVEQSAQMLLRMVAKWDLYADEDDEKAGITIPLDEEGLADVPAEIIFATIAACSQDGKPPKAQAGKSRCSFSQKE